MKFITETILTFFIPFNEPESVPYNPSDMTILIKTKTKANKNKPNMDFENFITLLEIISDLIYSEEPFQ